MSEATTVETVMIEGLTISQVVWRKFKRMPTGYVERVLDANPGISATQRLPVGTRIVFPVEGVVDQRKRAGVVRLWD